MSAFDWRTKSSSPPSSGKLDPVVAAWIVRNPDEHANRVKLGERAAYRFQERPGGVNG
jgi:hypothetical protein